MKNDTVYRVINLMTGETWKGESKNAKEAYKKITINKGDTTVLTYGNFITGFDDLEKEINIS